MEKLVHFGTPKEKSQLLQIYPCISLLSSVVYGPASLTSDEPQLGHVAPADVHPDIAAIPNTTNNIKTRPNTLL